jgi:hypothetical protein
MMIDNFLENCITLPFLYMLFHKWNSSTIITVEKKIPCAVEVDDETLEPPKAAGADSVSGAGYRHFFFVLCVYMALEPPFRGDARPGDAYARAHRSSH